MQDTTIHDTHRDIQFRGEAIGAGTTHEQDALRWFEIIIYRTEGGQYIVHKIGRTRVYHGRDAKCSNSMPDVQSVVSFFDDDPDRYYGSAPCTVCNPMRLDVMDDTDKIRVEVDRHSGTVCATPQEVIEALHNKDRDTGARYLTRTARQALRAACVKDVALRDSYMVEHVR